MHNVRVEQINEVAKQSKSDASLAQLDFNFEGSWNTNNNKVQFTGDVKFPNGETTLEADFPSFLGGEGRAPIGRPSPVSPWGKRTLGKRTRRSKKYSDKLIIRRSSS